MKIPQLDLASHPKLLNDCLREGKVISSKTLEIDDETFLKLLEKHKPTLPSRVANYIGSRLRIVKSGLIKVSVKTMEERLAICKKCIFFHENTCMHKKCGCNIPKKSVLETEKCSIGKW